MMTPSRPPTPSPIVRDPQNMMIPLRPATDALIVIDPQNDFCDGGALAVPGGQEVLPGIAALAQSFSTIVLTQDFHPPGHASFASTHGQAPGSTANLAYGPQTLWPDHCVQGTPGAAFHATVYRENAAPEGEVPRALADRAAVIVRKGMNPGVDSYSAFFENDQTTATGLAGWLRERGITRVFCVGLAYDFCVGFSALDARKVGLEAVVVKHLTRAIAMPVPEGTSETAMDAALMAAGVLVLDLPKPRAALSP